MKQGKTLSELAVEVKRQADSKMDFQLPASELQYKNGLEQGVAPHFEFDFNDTTLVPQISDHTHSQIAGVTGIPKRYYDRMKQEAPEMHQQNVNHWMHSSGKSHLIRTLDGSARALLSDRYRMLDNDTMMEVAVPALASAGAELASCEITESNLYLKAVTPRVELDITPGDAVQAGLVISNCEIGGGSFKVEAFLHRLVCTNGMIAPEARFVQTHLGAAFEKNGIPVEAMQNETRAAADRAFWLAVRDTIQHFFSVDGFEQIVSRFRAAKEDRIEVSAAKAVEVTAKHVGLQERETESVLEHLIRDGDMNRFGMVNAITRAAQDVESYDRATELERLGGRVLELPRNQWETIAEAA